MKPISFDRINDVQQIQDSQKLNLPCPRLQLTWIEVQEKANPPADQPWLADPDFCCIYSIVLPVDKLDIRSNIGEEYGVRTETHGYLSSTMITGIRTPTKPMTIGEVIVPYRDGVHILRDAAILKLPAFAVWGQYSTELLPKPPKDEPKEHSKWRLVQTKEKLADNGVWIELIAHIRKNETGEIRKHTTEAFLASGASTPSIFIWQTGNYACDCNREIFFSDDDSQEAKCSDGRFSVNLENPVTGEIIYREFEDSTPIPSC